MIIVISMILTIREAALALSRWVELSILSKATIMLVIGLILTRLAGRTRASVRHLLLAATFAMLLALPLIIVIAPGVTIEVAVSPPSDPATVSRAVTPSDDILSTPASASFESRGTKSSNWSAPSWMTTIRLVWFAGAILLLVPVAVDLWRFRLIRRYGLPWPERHEFFQSLTAECGVRRSVEISLNEDTPAPITYGMWHPAIVLPSEAREWSEADLRRALIHELEHVRRGDWAIQLMARAICACYWFHPLVWMAWRRMSLEAERACDDAVVQIAECTDYAEQLVLLARRLSKTQLQPTLGMTNRSDLSTRVSALLDGRQRRGRAGLLTAASAIIIASLITLSIAPVRAVVQSRNQAELGIQESNSRSKGRVMRRPGPLDRALIEASENGDVSDIDKLLNAGANVNCVQIGDGTPLLVAAGKGHLAAVRLLLDRGADPNLPVSGDGSPLIVAAREGHLAAVRLLLDRGADPNLPVSGDGNPLIMAAREGHLEVVALLLDRGANIDQIVPDDENALIQASGEGHLNVVKLLVSRHADVNARVWIEPASERPNGEWRTPLGMARKGGHQAVVDFLQAAGARE